VNFWRVLEFDKFAGEWPLLKKNTNTMYFHLKVLQLRGSSS
jgi:hypothetical protein